MKSKKEKVQPLVIASTDAATRKIIESIDFIDGIGTPLHSGD